MFTPVALVSTPGKNLPPRGVNNTTTNSRIDEPNDTLVDPGNPEIIRNDTDDASRSSGTSDNSNDESGGEDNKNSENQHDDIEVTEGLDKVASLL
jgi:hypothetical protein